MAAGLSSGMAFQIGWQKSGGMISGDLGHASQIQGPLYDPLLSYSKLSAKTDEPLQTAWSRPPSS